MNTDNSQIHICENCGTEHDGSYGSGRFCSKHCRRMWSGKQSNITMKKNGTKKCNFNVNKKDHGRKPLGTWKCDQCNLIFETRKQLQEHAKKLHKYHTCRYCQSQFETGFKLGNHILHCNKNPKYLENKKHIAKMSSLTHKNSKHSEEHKQKTSKSMIKFRRSLKTIYRSTSGFIPSYNPCSIQYFEQLSKEMNWNLQHAENGGEYTICGYFLDAYDEERNIVVEYDESRHYKDVENNLLVDEDIERQNIIIEHLHCQFYRYNEKTKVLWKVN